MVLRHAIWWRVLACCTLLAVCWPGVLWAEEVDEIKKLDQEYLAKYKLGQYSEAEPLAKQMLAIAEESAKPETIARCLGRLGLIYRAEGRYAEAEPLLKRALGIREERLGPEHVDVAAALVALAEVIRYQGRCAEAEPLVTRSLAIREKALGPDHLGVAASLNELGSVYKDQSQLSKAESFYKRALAIREQKLKPDHTDIAGSLNNLAEVARFKGQYAESAELYQRALAIYEKKLGPDHPDVARILNNLGLSYFAMARYAEAEPLYRRAIEIREKKLGPDHPEVVQTINNLANLFENEGKFAEAERLLKRALETREKVLGPEHPATASSADDLAISYFHQGRTSDAEPLFKRSLAIREKVLPADHPAIAISLNDLATMYRTLGRYAESEPLYKRALAIREKQLGADHPSIAQCVNNLAKLYQFEGRDAEAAAMYQRALDIRTKALGPEHPYVASTLNSLADLAVNDGRYAEAEPLYQRALAIREKSYGPDHPDVASTLQSLSRAYTLQKRYADAEPLCRRALANCEKSFGPDHVEVAVPLSGLVQIYGEQKRYAEAIPLADRVIKILDTGGASPARRYRGYYQRAQLFWGLGKTTEAIADLKQAMELAEEQRILGSGGERERAQLFAKFSEAFDRMVLWQAVQGDFGEALDAMERSRARSLLDQMDMHDIDLLAGVPDDQAAQLRQREAEVQTRQASLEKQLEVLDERKDLSADQRREQAKELQAQLRKAQSDYVVVYADIRNASPAYRLAVGQDHKPVMFDKLAKWVDDQNAVMFEYSIGRDGACVLVLRSGAAPRLEKLSVADDQARVLGIDAGDLTAKKLGAALSNKKNTGVLQLLKGASNSTHSKDAVAGLAVLWKLLIPQTEQAALQEGKLKRLVIIPDGPLAGLPFETLVVLPGEHPQYLLDVGPPIEYAPSATILMNLAERRTSGDGETPPVLTVGNPRYEKRSADQPGEPLAELNPSTRYATLGGSLSELPFTKLEVAWVAQVFGKNGMKVTQLERDQATEANVRGGVGGRRILHLACHGLVDQAYGNLFGALALTPGPRPGDSADDGFLTLAEIYTLNLGKTELAILSACDTNYGPRQEGEGVYALSRGFLVAGTRRVVASNWLVDDEAAASLIRQFCGELATAEKRGEPPDYADALHRAKRWIRQQEHWENPFYWGTFVLVGPN